jgi:SAM-dependent methyltransferase
MTTQTPPPAHDTPDYLGPKYLSEARFASYGRQIQEALTTQARRFIEIGPGPGLITHVLRRCGREVTTVDIDQATRPDVVGDVMRLPFVESSFEAALAYEVLEHLPFDCFGPALRELGRVAQTHILLSLPDCRPYVRFEWWRKGHPFRKATDVPWSRARPHSFDGEHHWEVNSKGCGLATVCAAIAEAGLSVTKTYRVWSNPYHRIFLLRCRPPDDQSSGPNDLAAHRERL